MKRVSFGIAKCLKEAGYPQECGEGTLYFAEDTKLYSYDSELYPFYGEAFCVCPTYLEAWLWLWREKGKFIDIVQDVTGRFIALYGEEIYDSKEDDDPEEAIIAAIEYLVDNDLIK